MGEGEGTTGSHHHIPSALDAVYPTTYYDGTSEVDGATAIAVKEGDHAGIDVRLSPVAALHLIFRLAPDQRGFQIPVLQRHVFDSVESVETGEIRPVGPGVFEMSGVAPGQYTVQARNSSSGEMEQASDVDLQHNGQELNTGRGEALGNAKVTVKMMGQESIPKQLAIALIHSRPRTVAYNRADDSGAATFENLSPGKYSLMVMTATRPYFVMRSTSQNGENSGHEINIAPGENLELTAYVVGGVVSVKGMVHKAGKAVSGVMVVLIPKDPDTHLELFRRDQSDFDGTFSVQGVVPGRYAIVAVEDAWGFDWLKPGILARYAQHGQELTIGELMQGSVYLPEPVEVQPR